MPPFLLSQPWCFVTYFQQSLAPGLSTAGPSLLPKKDVLRAVEPDVFLRIDSNLPDPITLPVEERPSTLSRPTDEARRLRSLLKPATICPSPLSTSSVPAGGRAGERSERASEASRKES
jgi:hypothetical protein